MSEQGLRPDLQTLDEKGRRKTVHPTEVKGRWRNRKSIVQWILLVFFLSIPWLKVSGRPFLRFDVSLGEFYILGQFFHVHDAPMILFLALSFILFFGLLTVLFGRVWCGWACPQTVFIEKIFREIERWFEGPALERRRLEFAPWTLERTGRHIGKWISYFLVSTVIMHSFVAIFTGPEKLAQMIAHGPSDSWGTFLFVSLSTLLILFDFGWFREQFCIFVCPYGRIQSVFQDDETKTVAYDVSRGEPRKIADCIDCRRCVQVCPTGIDIRDGSSQLECIACTACMDACDDVMGRLHRPLGLIRYASTRELKQKTKTRWIRGRSVVYAFLLFLVLSLMIWTVSSRGIAMIEVFKTRGQPYLSVSGDQVVNLFMAEVSNETSGPIEVEFFWDAPTSDQKLIMPNNPIRLEKGAFLKNPFTIQFSTSILQEGKAKAELRIRTQSLEDSRSEETRKAITLIGPFI
jgi:cytochrome c oxidase accessory protein FixG